MKKIFIAVLCTFLMFACSKAPQKITAEESMRKGLTYFQKKKYD